MQVLILNLERILMSQMAGDSLSKLYLYQNYFEISGFEIYFLYLIYSSISKYLSQCISLN